MLRLKPCLRKILGSDCEHAKLALHLNISGRSIFADNIGCDDLVADLATTWSDLDPPVSNVVRHG